VAWPLEEQLYEEGYAFDFFQAVRVLERLETARKPVGRAGPPEAEAARFRAYMSLSFPPSAIHEVSRPTSELRLPAMTVTFLGLTGPSGVLPRHYTEILLRQEREAKGDVRHALRDWLDLFNHRLISLFYRAWEKYRFYLPYERGEYTRKEPDAFTRALFSLIGLGEPALRGRLRVAVPVELDLHQNERVLKRVDDLSLLYYSGFLAHRPRCAVALEAMLHDYFQLPVHIRQFLGQWLRLEAGDQTQLGSGGRLGVNTVAGSKVWDVQTKARVRLGPLGYRAYEEFLPDRTAVPERKAFFLLVHLVRLYVGRELDFDVQLVLRADEVPACRLVADGGLGPRLGWNTWLFCDRMARDAEDAVFEEEEVVWVGGARNR
jgi:type VI secretion system protein ImpH